MKIMIVDPSRYSLGTKVTINDATNGSVLHSTTIVNSVPELVKSVVALAVEHGVTQIYCDNNGVGMSVYDKLIEKTQTNYSNIVIKSLER